MKLEIEIPDTQIVNIFITALEGGSNYWYNLPDIQMARKHYKDSGLAGSEKVIKAVLEHNEVIPVYDLEDEDSKLGEISQANIKRGIQLFLNDGDRAWDEGMDAGEADVFFQYVVMGEIVFG